MTPRWMGAIAALLLAGCGCGDHEEAIAMANGLSPARLARLHADMKALNTKSPRITFDEDHIPQAFADLHPRRIRVLHGIGQVYLVGCWEDQTMLIVHGFRPGNTPTVRLLPGEDRGESRVRWRGPPNATESERIAQ